MKGLGSNSVKEQLRRPDSSEEEFRVRKGGFVGLVQRCGNKYRLQVQDTRRESPTIHGSGIDFASAVTTVTQLLDALVSQELSVDRMTR